MHAGAGHSENALGVEATAMAVGEAMREAGVDSADLVFLFATYHYAGEIQAMLDMAVDMAGTEAVVGCSGMGVLSGEGEIERGPGVTVLALSGEALRAVPFLARGEDVVAEIGEAVSPSVSGESLLVILPDVFQFHPTELIAGLREYIGEIPVVGGAASGDPMAQKTLQWCGREVAGDGVAGVLLSGGVRAFTGVAQGCQPFGQAYTITKAEGNVIHEIAFSPAFEALKEAVETLTPEERESAARSIFIGLAMDEYASRRGRGDFLVRNLMGRDPDTGALIVGEQVEVGQTVQFNRRTADAAHEDIEQVVADLASGHTAFGLYFNCLGRGFGLYGQPDHDVSVIRNLLGAFPMVGFFGNAEFAPIAGKNFVHNYTGVLVLFSEEG